MSSLTTDYIRDRVEIDEQSQCWIWQLAKNHDGYGVATCEKKYVRAHRLSYALLCGEVPDGMCVLHRCDVRSCVNPDHLFIGTPADNSADMVRKGRSAAGSSHSQAVLSEIEVTEILASSDSQRDLAARYGVSHGTIAHIKLRNTWRGVLKDA